MCDCDYPEINDMRPGSCQDMPSATSWIHHVKKAMSIHSKCFQSPLTRLLHILTNFVDKSSAGLEHDEHSDREGVTILDELG